MNNIKNTNNIEIPTSIGELIDKISILMVKKMKVSNEIKLKYITEELELLNQKAESFLIDSETNKGLQKLIEINSDLWDIEDEIRDLESKKIFDDTFVLVARKVYKLNDRRFEVKNEINEYYQSSIREIKNYKKY